MRETLLSPMENEETTDKTSVKLEKPLATILGQAVDERATDVHLDPVEDGKMVRFRVDGALYEKDPIPMADCQRVLGQLKIAADDIDIGEVKRLRLSYRE